MRVVPAERTRTLAICVAAGTLAIWASVPSGVAKTPGCASFSSQADAQEHFTHSGGAPARNVGGLDGDGDGVACEGSPGPYAGFATIGYNRQKRFFYGTASMPLSAAGDGFACLTGNRHYPEGPRLLKVYRAVPGPDAAISRDVGAEAKLDSGRLVWKLDRDPIVAGRYYVAFEEQLRTSPYGSSECPAFRSREAYLPRPPRHPVAS